MEQNFFVDENLLLAVLKELDTLNLGKESDNFGKITELHAFNKNIKNIQGIELLKNLKKICLWDNEITDIRPLAQLEELEEI